jgi:hypothetical protein
MAVYLDTSFAPTRRKVATEHTSPDLNLTLHSMLGIYMVYPGDALRLERIHEIARSMRRWLAAAIVPRWFFRI